MLAHVSRRATSVRLGLARIGFALAFVGLWSATVHAQQSGTAQQGVGTTQRVPFVGQAQPVAPTPEQQQARDEAMETFNIPGPPLPVEPSAQVAPPSVPATPGRTGPVAPAPGGAPAPLAGPNDFKFFRTQAQTPFYNGGKSNINEPHVGTAGPVVFMTSNWDAAFSTDGGQTFTFVNPYSEFGTIDGGFCCDQTVIFDPSRNLMIWQLQYVYSATTQQNTYVIAWANPSSVASGGWCSTRFTPGSFGLAAGLQLDYPHVALSNNYVWFTANVYDHSNPANWQTTVIWNIPLDQMVPCGGYTFNYFVQAHFNFTPTQSATSTMYWGSHNSTSSIRIYRWDEGAGTIFWDDVTIPAWTRNLPYQCPGPDSLNWCGRNPNDGRIETGWVANGVIGFMWNAGQDGTYPYPYIYVARFNQSNRSAINQPIIWFSSYAWQFPAIGVNSFGDIAGSAYWGGGSNYPNMVALIDDFLSSPPPPWENYFVAGSGKGANSWGDWYSSRRHSPYGATWVTSGEALAANGTVSTIYAWFGRQIDMPQIRNTHDFNADAMSDILWRDNNSGGVAMWLMSGNAILSSLGVGNVPTSWQIVGQRDFNYDGYRDILWRNNTGGVVMWFMNGATASPSGVGNVPTNWQIVGTGDFNNDGFGDILWRDNNSGGVAMWLMAGNAILSSLGVGNVPLNWVIAGTGDFNGDGKWDILWRDNNSGGVAMWLMNGGTVVSSLGVGNVPLNWVIAGTGDFNGDGMSDVLWRDNNSGGVAMWLMNGATVMSSLGVGNVPLNWVIAETGDFNGDAMSDVLWHDNNSGGVAMWLMNGATVVSSLGVGTVPTNWQIQGLNAD